MSEATPIPPAGAGGEPCAGEELLPLLYTELRRFAARRMARERPGQTLQATALVHEAWLKLAREKEHKWNSPQHFFCAAATAMRRILIDRARRKNSPKHGGDLYRVELEEVSPAGRMPSDELIALDEALEQLAEKDAEAARLVELRFFVGLGHKEAAELMGISKRRADGIWAYARAWLLKAVKKELGANGGPKSP